MKIQIGEGKLYEVEPEVLDLLALQYGTKLLEQYSKMDATISFAMKVVTKQVVKELLKAFGVTPKLPRGADPSIFLLRAYIVLMRESLNMITLSLVSDEEINTIEAGHVTYSDLDAFTGKMAGYLEGLKEYGPGGGNVLVLPGTDQGGTRPELAPGGEEAVGEDDGGEDNFADLVPAFS